MSNKLDDLAIEINNIKENKAYSIVVLESRIGELKKEKLDLCKANAELRKENTTMKQTIADLKSVNKNLEKKERKRRRLHRRIYKSEGPNACLHLDGN